MEPYPKPPISPQIKLVNKMKIFNTLFKGFQNPKLFSPILNVFNDDLKEI